MGIASELILSAERFAAATGEHLRVVSISPAAYARLVDEMARMKRNTCRFVDEEETAVVFTSWGFVVLSVGTNEEGAFGKAAARRSRLIGVG
jgi:hypothetical protein